MTYRPSDWPPHCPNGHELRAGTAHYGGFTVCHSCPSERRGGGHHYVICNTCSARLWLEHPGAVWEVPDGTGWRPA